MELNRRMERTYFRVLTINVLKYLKINLSTSKEFFLGGRGRGGGWELPRASIGYSALQFFSLSSSITLKPDSTKTVMIWKNYSFRSGYSFFIFLSFLNAQWSFLNALWSFLNAQWSFLNAQWLMLGIAQAFAQTSQSALQLRYLQETHYFFNP